MSDATVEKWGVFEASFDGPSGGNPYLDVAFDAVFTHKSREVRVPGFYDGNGPTVSASCRTSKASGRF